MVGLQAQAEESSRSRDCRFQQAFLCLLSLHLYQAVSTWRGLPWDSLPLQGLLAQEVLPTEGHVDPPWASEWETTISRGNTHSWIPWASGLGLLCIERKMSEVLSKAIYHDVFILPWPSWLAGWEAAAKASGAEAGRWDGERRKVRGKSCFTDWVLSQSSVLGPYYELLGSFGAHVPGTDELWWLFPALLNSWCSKGSPSRFAVGLITYYVLVPLCFAWNEVESHWRFRAKEWHELIYAVAGFLWLLVDNRQNWQR